MNENKINAQQDEYKSRINRVIDYIMNHLENDFTLDELAQIANFSKYHFHRIFNLMVGENLFEFIQRLRVEKAASFLMYSTRSITEITFDCGFSSSAVFSRCFKKFYKMSPSDWRKNKFSNSNLSQTDRNIPKIFDFIKNKNLQIA